MKTICITSFHSIISRNILQTSILADLKKDDIRIVLLVPEGKVDFFKDAFGTYVDEVIEVGFKKRWGFELFRLISISSISLENLYIRRLKSQRKWGKICVAYVSHYVIGNVFFLKRVLRTVDNLLFSSKHIEKILVDVKSTLVFVTDIYLAHDKEVLRSAKRLGIHTVGMVRSWDNVTTKGILMVVPEKILVHNEILRDELWDFNRIPNENVEVVGIPHYDVYGKKCRISREAFCEKMNLDPKKKIILFAPGGSILYRDDHLLLHMFKRMLEQKVIDAQFLVRLPPNDVIDMGTFETDKRFVFDKPGTEVVGGRRGNELSTEGEHHLQNTLCHSDALITLVSTMVIDAATFDIPTIVVAFNLKNYTDDANKFGRYSHFNKLLSRNLCTLAHSEYELSTILNIYFKDRSVDAHRRKGIIDLYCLGNDGNASRRVSDILHDTLRSI